MEIVIVVSLIANALLAIPVAYVASEKGRSAGGFYALSFFLSFLVGILVVLALPSKKAPRTLSASGNFSTISYAQEVKCPFCAEWIKPEAKVCKHCGREVSTAIQEMTTREKELQEQEKLQRQQSLEKEAAEQERQRLLSNQQRKDFFQKKSTRTALVVVGMIAIGTITLAIALPIIGKANEASLRRDLQTQVPKCDSVIKAQHDLYKLSYEISPNNKSVLVEIKPTKWALGAEFESLWFSCLVAKIGIDTPNKSINQFIKDAIGSGETSEFAYGNLSVSAEMGADGQYSVTISPKS